MTRVPELRFFGFDGEWVSKKLCNEFNVQMGQSPNSENYVNDSNYPPLIQGNADIENGKIKPRIFTTQLTKISYPNDILMTVRAPVGDLALNDKEVVIGRGVCSLSGNRFLYYDLENKKVNNYWKRFSSGSTFESINSSDIKESNIVMPSLEEQEKIGNLFSKIDQLIENQEKLLDQSIAFKKSMVQKMFPKKDSLVPEFRFDGFDNVWQEKRLKELGESFNSLTGKTKDDFGHGNAQYVTYKNVYTNTIAREDKLEKVVLDLKQNMVKKGDIFFTTSSEVPEEVGLSSAWTHDIDYVYLNSFSFGYRPLKSLNTYFLAYLFRSQSFRKTVVGLAQGSTRYNISKYAMLDIIVKIPTPEEQEKIGNFFKNLDDKIAREEELLDAYKMMKKSLLQKMFV
ncbi:restriction endonuclease subunit S [uncultured Anaerococcus sp.]|uniref:restriction endonuclease subunit S n=1 Tax=uncultured Anaerococcus sp. TaxID=293428 RepID=UPI0026133763|nr:restriction endonuclease subunit S [uncultured Anaerococcus sp.]